MQKTKVAVFFLNTVYNVCITASCVCVGCWYSRTSRRACRSVPASIVHSLSAVSHMLVAIVHIYILLSSVNRTSVNNILYVTLTNSYTSLSFLQFLLAINTTNVRLNSSVLLQFYTASQKTRT